jgi:peroxiredoxin
MLRTSIGAVLALPLLLRCFFAQARAEDSAKEDRAVAFKDLDGRSHTPLSQPDKKATVLFFLLPDCPISNSYAPEIQRICKDYEESKIAAFIVHADPDVSVEAAQKHAKEYGLACPVLRDPAHVLVKRTGVTTAPEVAVLAADGTVVYRGRIDDWYTDYGKRRAQPAQRDLRNALDAIVQGKQVPTATTKALGCPLPEPKK